MASHPIAKVSSLSKLTQMKRGEGASLHWLLQAATLVVEGITIVFAMSMLLSFDQAPSTIERINWGWIENQYLNDLPGFQSWCRSQFAAEDCTNSRLSFRANIKAGLRASTIKVTIWDSQRSQRRVDHTNVALYTDHHPDTQCALLSGMCSTCNSSTIGAFVMFVFLLSASIAIFVQDVRTMMNINLNGVQFMWSRFVLHLGSLAFTAIAFSLIMNNCLDESSTGGIKLKGGPMNIVGVFTFICHAVQLAIQGSHFCLSHYRSKVSAW